MVDTCPSFSGIWGTTFPLSCLVDASLTKRFTGRQNTLVLRPVDLILKDGNIMCEKFDVQMKRILQMLMLTVTLHTLQPVVPELF